MTRPLSAAPKTDVGVVGGGQAGLAVGYFLHLENVAFIIVDAEPSPGGAWRHG